MSKAEKVRQAGVPHSPVDVNDCDDGMEQRVGNTQHNPHTEPDGGANLRRKPVRKTQAENPVERKDSLKENKKNYGPGGHR